MHNKLKLTIILSGLFLISAALALPTQWYFHLPLPEDIDRFPITGVTLFKSALIVEGLLLFLVGATGWQYQRIPAENLLTPRCTHFQQDNSSTYICALLLILLLAVILRSLGLSQSFWIDEVTTLGYAKSDFIEQLTVFVSPNNHLLNTVLIKLSINLFGESEWSARLPAVIFGAATIPVLYWLTKQSSGRWPAIAASLLLAVSYHHIFFSQNARGYSAHLFLSLLATGLFLKGIRRDELHVWILYIVVTFLNFTALINSVFVFLSHAAAGIIALSFLKQQGGDIWPLLRRLFMVFLVSGLLVFQFYSIEIPQIYLTLSQMYSDQATGFSLFSVDFLAELARGISAGFGTGVFIAAIPFLLVALTGFITFFKNDFLLATLLILPGIFTTLYLAARGLTVSPRFYLFELFFVLICAVNGIISSINWLGNRLKLGEQIRHKLSVVVVILLATLSVASLSNYYRTPKQGYREAVEYIEGNRTPATQVIVVYTAETGIAYYHHKLKGGGDNGKYIYVRDVASFFGALAAAENGPIYIVTTFHRALGISLPRILNELEGHWHIEKTFPATIGNGAVCIWVKKPVT